MTNFQPAVDPNWFKNNFLNQNFEINPSFGSGFLDAINNTNNQSLNLGNINSSETAAQPGFQSFGDPVIDSLYQQASPQEQANIRSGYISSRLSSSLPNEYTALGQILKNEREATRNEARENREAQAQAFRDTLPYKREQNILSANTAIATALAGKPSATMPLMAFNRTPKDWSIPMPA